MTAVFGFPGSALYYRGPASETYVTRPKEYDLRFLGSGLQKLDYESILQIDFPKPSSGN